MGQIPSRQSLTQGLGTCDFQRGGVLRGKEGEGNGVEQGEELSKNGVSAGLGSSLVLELWSVSCTVEVVPAPGKRAGAPVPVTPWLWATLGGLRV